jgi:glycosyltransferase involved in cell wall biosynthesis
MDTSVSTIIPAFNAERTIRYTIESALAQDHGSHEIIVVDDGSSDSTARIVESYDPRVRLIVQSNQGTAAARNTGAAHSIGHYLAFLDADDLWAPHKLSTMIYALSLHPSASLAFSEFGLIDEEGHEFRSSAIRSSPLFEAAMTTRPFPAASLVDGLMTSTWVLTRAKFDAVGGFCEDFKRAEGWEDCWILVLLRELGEFVCVPDKLTLYRATYQFEMADKYGPGTELFVKLVNNRFGRHGKNLIRDAKNVKCRWLLTKIAHQMDYGDKRGALASLLEILRFHPSYFLSQHFRNRLRLLHNVNRLRELCSW